MSNQIVVNVISDTVYAAKAHGVHTAFLEGVASLRARQDVTVTVNSYGRADILHIHTIGPYGLRALLFRRCPAVISAHVTPDSFVGSLVGAKYWYFLAKWYLRFIYNRASTVLAVSQEVAAELKAMGVQRPIKLAPNTIDTARFAPSATKRSAARAKLGITQDSFLVIGVGQVQPRKGIDSLMRVAAEQPKMRFIWVGGVPFKQFAADHKHMEQLMKHPPANVSFTGNLSQPAVNDYYWAADVFWLPSYQETFGIVVVEAAASGLPILLRGTSQYSQTFTGGYIASSEEQFATMLNRLKTDTAYHAKWVEAATKIAERYDSHQGAEELVQLYKSLIGV